MSGTNATSDGFFQQSPGRTRMRFADFEILSTLKEDIFGTTTCVRMDSNTFVCRNYSQARNIFFRVIASYLAKREAMILKKASIIDEGKIPRLIYFGNGILCRSYIPGQSLRANPNVNSLFYVKARQILDELHDIGVIHNDLEKPENWLVTDDGNPAIIDFQLSVFFSNRNNKLYLIGKQEDIRHLYKNKKRFCTSMLTDEELRIVNMKHPIDIFFMNYIKPIYEFVTRRVLRYSDRDHSKYSR
jgi:serine/threonine protein kinase